MLFLTLANSTSVWNLHRGPKKQKPLTPKRKDRKEQTPDQTCKAEESCCVKFHIPTSRGGGCEKEKLTRDWIASFTSSQSMAVLPACSEYVCASPSTSTTYLYHKSRNWFTTRGSWCSTPIDRRMDFTSFASLGNSSSSPISLSQDSLCVLLPSLVSLVPN